MPTELRKNNRVTGIAVCGFPHIHDRKDRNTRLQSTLSDHLSETSRDVGSDRPSENNVNPTGTSTMGDSETDQIRSGNANINRIDQPLTVAVLDTRNVVQILDCLRLGVDYVGTGLPELWAVHGMAFVLPLRTADPSNTSETEQRQLEDNDNIDTNGCFNMMDDRWKADTRPLVEGCDSLACNGYSRAYIHHLLKAKELLGQILLMAHNLHHLMEMCKVATVEKQNGRIEQYVAALESRLPVPTEQDLEFQ